MARNYKRDRGGRFAKVNSLSGKKVKQLPSTAKRGAPIVKPAKGNVLVAVDGRGNVRKVSPAQARKIQADNARIKKAATIGAVAGGYVGLHGGPAAIPVGVLVGSYAGAAIAAGRNRRRR